MTLKRHFERLWRAWRKIEDIARQYPVIRSLLFWLLLGGGIGLLIGVLIYNDDESIFRSAVTVRCHRPPNVGSFVQQAMNDDIIVKPGKATDGAAGKPGQEAALRASLCANEEISGTVEEILKALDEDYEACFEYRGTPTGQKSFHLRLNSVNICVAEFSKIGRKWVRGQHKNNPILCIPDIRIERTQVDELPLCPPKQLKRLGWLKQ